MGSALILMGAGLLFPVAMARSETGAWSEPGIAVAVAGIGLLLMGLVAVATGFQRRVPMPSGVLVVVISTAPILGSWRSSWLDRIVRQDGRLVYWTTFLLPPALLLYGGLLNARPWSWWTARAAAAIGVLWFLGFLVLLPFVHLQRDGAPVPWQGRVYMAIVTLSPELLAPHSGRWAEGRRAPTSVSHERRGDAAMRRVERYAELHSRSD